MSTHAKNSIKIRILTLCNIILTFGATASSGFLSFAGATALGFGFSFAMTSAFLTAIVCVAVNWSLIDEAFDRLFDVNGKDPYNNPWLKISFIIASILAAISFSATTLISAIPLCVLIPFFTLNMAFAISGISTVAYFFITYTTLFYTLERINKYYVKLQKNKQHININNNKLTYAVIGIVLASCVFLFFSTADTWWHGTIQGLQLLLSLRAAKIISILTVPFSILQATCYNFTYAIEASRKLLSSDLVASIYQPFLDYLDHVKKDSGLKYNPFYHVSTFLAKITAWTLFIAHAGAHGLMAGRASLSTIAGTIVDFFADAHFTVASASYINTQKNSGSNSQDQANVASKKTYDRKHEHGVFDLIIVCSQVVITFPFQIPAIAYNYFMNTEGKSVKTCVKESFYFVDDYIREDHHDHDHGNCSGNHRHTPPAVVHNTTPVALPTHRHRSVLDSMTGLSSSYQAAAQHYTQTASRNAARVGCK